jgi:hypothetical protein
MLILSVEKNDEMSPTQKSITNIIHVLMNLGMNQQSIHLLTRINNSAVLD